MTSAPSSPADRPVPEFDGKAFARSLPTTPGVYRMLGDEGAVLYVGKASALRARVASYFSGRPQSARIALMLARTRSMEFTVTRTESEALILENELIKSLRPRFNVLLRDDKSYPYIRVTPDRFPRVMFYRGARSAGGRFFGPYPGAGAIRETLNLLHRLFHLRSCEDSVFRSRTRPCLQHQIGRCSAPCVGLIDAAAYAESVRRATLLLEGRSADLLDDLTAQMEQAAKALDFEQAARLRDLIAQLRTVQAKQFVEGSGDDADVIAVRFGGGQACVLVQSFRRGQNHGTRSYFPKLNGEDDESSILAAFVTQHYLAQTPPREVLLARAIEDAELISEVLTEQAGRRVQVRSAVRGARQRLVEAAQRSCDAALASALQSSEVQSRRIEDLQQLLGLEQAPTRIECFDVSHTQGELTVASCVVFDAEGPVRAQYRRFNIEGITPGDDFAAMQQALRRRFTRGVAEGVLPDLLLIDGGKGQVAQAHAVLGALEVAGTVVVGVAKGPERKAGRETLILPDGRELAPGPLSAGLHLIQHVRDEAHRFAITGHRGRRGKARTHSALEDVEGIGPRRRVKLLRHFGGLAGLKGAGVEEIARVEGINEALAKRIYAALHGETGV
ncbi:MAG: excinuclease ABC subunit UvrC [Xanthomonadales bacterium]|nr:excinuclease ABC subunit UvrC [Xanthomonadales bacterium]